MPTFDADSFAMIIVGVLTLAGVVISTLSNNKANKKTAESIDTQNALAAKALAEKELETTQRALDDHQRQQNMANIQNTISALDSKVDTLTDNLRYTNGRIDKLNMRFSTRLAENEENANRIIKVLTRNARQYSLMMRMHSQTDAAFKYMMDLQSSDIAYVKDIGDHIQNMNRILQGNIVREDNVASKHIASLCDKFSSTHDEFVASIIGKTADIKSVEALDVNAQIAKEEAELESFFDRPKTPHIDDIEFMTPPDM